MRGVVIIAGLMDSSGNIGTEGRYDILPIPWRFDALQKIVVGTMRFELGLKSQFRQPAFDLPPDSSEKTALSRGVGLIAWIRTQDCSADLLRLACKGWSATRARRVAAEVDHLSCCMPPDVIYRWPNEEAHDNAAMARFEVELIKRLENF